MLNKSVVKSKLKTVLTLLLLVLSFLASWGPILMLDLLESFVVLDRDAELWLRSVVEVLSLSLPLSQVLHLILSFMRFVMLLECIS